MIKRLKPVSLGLTECKKVNTIDVYVIIALWQENYVNPLWMVRDKRVVQLLMRHDGLD